MKILDPAELNFEKSENGFLRLKFNDGTIFERVECYPLFPLSKPDAYIAISKRTDSDLEEIGIIKSLNKLSAKQRSLVESEIQFRHFSPEIIDIHKINSKYGVDHWEVMTDKGEKTFIVQEVKENVMIKEDGLIVITDIDKCRYQIRDYRKLPYKARVELERTLL